MTHKIVCAFYKIFDLLTLTCLAKNASVKAAAMSRPDKVYFPGVTLQQKNKYVRIIINQIFNYS